MRNNNWNLIWGIIGVIIIIMTFVNNTTSKNLFGFEVNTWIYRGIWTLISIVSLLGYFKKRETK
ncbi:hypothetical protein [uncultured Polaribacter sp.]|uniref:hypothetical protein n=1 Tax=uncultured Polaribacter sp. TaxID=174711 RepID=UPI002637AA81|nr:hypothetical protein [uncultured Polaribacter sp.]